MLQIILLDPYDACVDWWALGVMVFTMLTGMVCILCDFVLNTKNDEIEHRMRQGFGVGIDNFKSFKLTRNSGGVTRTQLPTVILCTSI